MSLTVSLLGDENGRRGRGLLDTTWERWQVGEGPCGRGFGRLVVHFEEEKFEDLFFLFPGQVRYVHLLSIHANS